MKIPTIGKNLSKLRPPELTGAVKIKPFVNDGGIKGFNPTSLIIDEAPGKRMDLVPIGRMMFISPPEDNNPTPGMVGNIHLPENTAPKLPGYAICEVLRAGPECKQVKDGDRVVLCVVHAQKFVISGNDYWQLDESAVMGIVAK